MENNIALISKAVGLNAGDYATLYKFVIGISPLIVSPEEAVLCVNSYTPYGIEKLKPSELKILANGHEFIENQLKNAEAVGELQAYIEDPVRINSKDGLARLLYLRENGLPYKNSKGKYLNIPFDKKKFDHEYGVIDLTSYKTIISESLKPKQEQPDNSIKIVNSKENDLSTAITFEGTAQKVSEEIKETDNVETVNEYEQILSRPQTIGFDNNMFDRYMNLLDSIQHILIQINDSPEVDGSIIDNLSKLVAAGVESDEVVLKYSLTYGKNLSPIVLDKYTQAITEELEFIRDSKMERNAA